MSLRDQLQSSLGSTYVLGRELPGGGMSRVFVAEETALGRQVVVKVMKPETAADVSVDRFKREILLAARLQHPHIVPLLSAGVAAGLPYYAMPFVEGESLRARLSSHGELPQSEAVRILRDVASALAYAHERGVVHRDIKPDNVLLSGGSAMVTDFGVAKALSASSNAEPSTLTSLGVALGTPAYMAPEQASADPLLDHRADIYAWGVLAYELLTGSTPFAGRPPQAMLAAHITDPAESIAKRRPQLQPALVALVMQCLEKRPADRPQRAEDIVRQLDGITPSSGGIVPVASSRARATGVWVLAVLGVAIAIVTTFVLSRRESPQRGSGLQTIAVVPPERSSSDSAQYFADGVIETLIGALSKVPGLEVRSSNASFALTGKNLSIAEIANRLNVANVLHVSVRRLASNMRVSVELSRAADGTVLWHDTFARDVADVLTIQDSIAYRTVDALRIRLGEGEKETITSHGTRNLEAYDLYIRGRYLVARGDNQQMLQRALALFDSALAKDPKYALVYGSIATAWIQMADDFISAREGYTRSLEAAQRAVDLDPTYGEAYVLRALSSITLNRDFDASLRYARRGFELDSLSAPTVASYGAALGYSGRLDSAVVILDRAIALDPVQPYFHIVTARFQAARGDYAAAMAGYRRALELVPDMGVAWIGIADVLLAQGRPAEALDAVDRGASQPTRQSGIRARALAALGRAAEARRLTEELVAESRRRYISADFIAAAFTALGDHDEAFKWLGQANEDRSQPFLLLEFSPTWIPLRGDPRFRRLVERIKKESPT